jgi:cyclic-di-GMP phosphodiesterase TipF (flagellum assembly factor)
MAKSRQTSWWVASGLGVLLAGGGVALIASFEAGWIQAVGGTLLGGGALLAITSILRPRAAKPSVEPSAGTASQITPDIQITPELLHRIAARLSDMETRLSELEQGRLREAPAEWTELTGEVGLLGGLVKDIAEMVATHDTAIAQIETVQSDFRQQAASLESAIQALPTQIQAAHAPAGEPLAPLQAPTHVPAQMVQPTRMASAGGFAPSQPMFQNPAAGAPSAGPINPNLAAHAATAQSGLSTTGAMPSGFTQPASGAAQPTASPAAARLTAGAAALARSPLPQRAPTVQPQTHRWAQPSAAARQALQPFEPAKPIPAPAASTAVAPAVAPPVVAPPVQAPVQEPAGLQEDGQRIAGILAAIEADQIELHLQPVVALPQRRTRFYEALSRLRLSETELLMPAEFLPLAERHGLMAELDERIVRRTLQVARHLARSGDASVACNISSAALAHPGFLRMVLGLVENEPDAAGRLILELSQATLRTLDAERSGMINALVGRGVRLSMDGVRDLRFDPLALAERGVRFVKVPAYLLLDEKSGGPIHPADIPALLARAGILLIAERVETEPVVADLLDLDVPLAQGFLFAMPRQVRTEVFAGAQPLAPPAGAPQPLDPPRTDSPPRKPFRAFLRRANA